MNLNLPYDFFANVFHQKPSSPEVAFEHALLAETSNVAVVGSVNINLQRYTRLGFCRTELQPSPRPIQTKYWGGEDADELYEHTEQALWEVNWNGTTLYVLEASWNTSCGSAQRSWVIAASQDVAEAFLLEVARKTNDPGNAILAFQNGRWARSTQLYEAVQKSSFDDLIIDESLKTAIRTDFGQFLEARQEYADLGLAWRRGALLIGPPGNGKTHCVRALVKELAVASLYVQSLQHQYLQSEQLLQMVFDRARGLRPCVLIFEDLDALVDERNQSFFLNQLDGLEKNDGLIVLATTNHPERIDSAIIDRPSRFDRKYHFHLPHQQRRVEFLRAWQQRLSSEVNWTAASVDAMAQATEGFSFAYLKELVVSSLLDWMSDSSTSFDDRIMTQQQLLASQMRTVDQAKPPSGPGHSPRRHA